MTHPSPGGRVFALDNLRAALVILVILHHAALVYSAFSPFYYAEPPFSDPLTFLLLALFALINQAWFMSALFFVAGYFTPDSYDRKGVSGYLAGRFLRLGLPLIVGIFLLDPLARIGYFLMPTALTGITEPPSLAFYPHMIGLGPLWFVALLLVFSIGYALWRVVTKGRAPKPHRAVPSRWIVRGFIVALALVTWLWRMVVPMGQEVGYANLSFPTLSYLPHYLALFVFGIMTRRNGWLPAAGRGAAWQGAFVSLMATILILPWALSGNFLQLTFSPGTEFVGNGSWQSGLFALWDATLAIGLLLAALGLFQDRVNREGPVWRFLARQSYAAYLIQAVVIVFAAWAISGLAWPGLVKFVLLSLIAVPVSFGLAYVLRLIPGAKRVI